GLALILCAYFKILNLYSAIGLIIIFLSTQGFAFPNSSALTMKPFTTNAGTASALMGALQMGMGVLTTALVSIFNDGTIMPMAVTMGSCAVLSYIILLIGSKKL
ncbi:MAG: Bcr/CflA family drug resistance efflux transporter, partial [Bacteroidetes bacterium]|nr:Bcr/CflA family drug resistance efflux transporter [Bacteroidota bacterium]